ncbi:tetratricopeptide repeat protein [Maricaulaceae bacterium MS644]
MLRLFALAAPVLLLIAAFAAPADAQSRREMAARLDAAEARLAEIESRALQGDPVAETLMERVDALEREQRVLTGEIERLAFENRQMRASLDQLQRTLNALIEGGEPGGGDPRSGGGPALLEPNEIDANDPFGQARADSVQPLQAPSGARAQRPTAQSGGSSGAGPAGGPAQLGGGEAALDGDNQVQDPDALYQRGRTRLLEGDFAGAREAFQAFTADHPSHARADEAWYWLGETHFVNGDLDAAADSYIASLRADRRGEQAPDALVRLGASLAGLGETGRACQVLGTFGSEFPNAGAEARRKASRESARIGCS